MATPRTAAIVLAAANASAICASQTPASGALTLNGAAVSSGVATLDAARRVLVTTTGNETGKTLTITGTDRNKSPIIERVSLPNAGTAYTYQDFLTVTGVTISAAAAAAMTVGTNTIASTRWIRMDCMVPVFNASAAVNLGGVTANVTIEVTLDEVDKVKADRAAGTLDDSASGLATSAFTPPINFPVSNGSSLTADTLLNVSTPVYAIRLTVNSGAATAGVRFTVLQASRV